MSAINKSNDNFYSTRIYDGQKVYRVVEIEGQPHANPKRWTVRLIEGRRERPSEEYKITKLELKGLRIDSEDGGAEIRNLHEILQDIINRSMASGTHVVMPAADYRRIERRAEAADKVESLIQSLGEEGLSDLVSQVTSNVRDRLAMLGAYAQQIQRREALNKFRELVNQDGAREIQFQRFLMDNSWVFGSGYCEVVDTRTLTLGKQQDYILRRTADAHLDIYEIKTTLDGQSPLTGSGGYLYPRAELSQAIGQVSDYLRRLDEDRARILLDFQLDVLRARSYIVIGRDHGDEHTRGLRVLNGHLHRIEVLTYDQLIKIAENSLG